MSAFYDLNKTPRNILNQAIVRAIISENNGALFDPSDLSTLYQDSAGTIPVAAVEQPVGLMLDKSQGLMLGPEFTPTVYSGTANVTGLWTIQPTIVRRNGDTNTSATLTLGSGIVAGKFYKVTCTISNKTGDDVVVRVGGGSGDYARLSSGESSAVLKAVGSRPVLFFAGYVGTTGTADITNISVRELYGYHATQPITASRPTLSARYNLLTKTEDFSDSVWVSSGCSAVKNYGVSPIGTITSALLTNSAADAYFSQTDGTIGVNKTLTAFVKNSSTGWVTISIASLAAGGNSAGYFINTTTGAKGAIFIGGTGYSVVSCNSDLQDNGWVKVILTVAGTNEVQRPVFRIAESDGNAVGPKGATVQLWGFDQRLGASAGQYQRVNTATDYDTNERYFPKYLRFDGVDDYLNLPYMGLYANGSASVVAGLIKLPGSSDTYAIGEGNSSDSDTRYGLVRLATSGAFVASYVRADDATTFLSNTGVAVSISTPNVVSVIDNSNSVRYKSALSDITDSYSRSVALTVNTTTIGALTSTAVVGYSLMKLYGLIITKSALTDAQRIKCERYAASKSGVIL